MPSPGSSMRTVKPLVFNLCLSHKQNIEARTPQMPSLTDTQPLKCQHGLSGIDPAGCILSADDRTVRKHPSRTLGVRISVSYSQSISCCPTVDGRILRDRS